MHLERLGAQHGAEREHQVVVDQRQPRREGGDDVLELHGVGARAGPFQPDQRRHPLDQPLDQGEGDAGRGPEGVVEDDADVGGVGRLADMLVEVLLGVEEIERAADLDVLAAQRAAALASRRSSMVRWSARPSPPAPGRPPPPTTVSATRTRSSKVMVEKSPAAPPARKVP